MTELSPKYSRTTCDIPQIYYEAIQIKVTTTDYYTFSSTNGAYADGTLHESYFNPYERFSHLIVESSKSCPYNEFKMTAHLLSNTTYVLVVATSDRHMIGPFSILASGPNNVTFNRIGKTNSVFADSANILIRDPIKILVTTDEKFSSICTNV